MADVTLQQLSTALKNAHAAGDTAAAQKLAAAIKARTAQPAAPAPSRAPYIEAPRQVGGGFLEGVGSMMPNPLTPIKGLISSLTGDTAGEAEALQQEKDQWSGGGVLKPIVPEAVEGYETPRMIGNFIGSNIVTPGGAATTGLKTGLKAGAGAVGREVLTGTTGALGFEAGRDIAQEYAPDSKATQAAAGLVGALVGGTAPSLAGAGKAQATKQFFGDDAAHVVDDVSPPDADFVNPSDAFRAAERLGIADELLPATFGNKRMRSLTQNVAMRPVGGGRTASMMETAPQVHGRRVGRTAQDIRGGMASDIENLPRNTQMTMDAAATGAQKRVADQYQSAEEMIGGGTIADVSAVDDTFRRIYQGDPADPASGPIGGDYRPGVQGRERVLQGDRTQPVDTALQQRLATERAMLENRLASAQQARTRRLTRGNPLQIDEADAVIANLLERLDENTSAIRNNTGAAVSQVKQWTGVNADMAHMNSVDNPGIGKGYAGKLADAGRGVLQNAADTQGPDIGGPYRVAREEWSDALGPEGYVTRVKQGLKSGEDMGALNWLTKQNLNAKENFQALQESVRRAAEAAPTPAARAEILMGWNQIRGDIIEGLGAKSAGQVETGSQWSPETFLSKFHKLKSPEVKAILSQAQNNPSALRELEDAATVAKGMRGLGREANASRTQTHALWSGLTAGGGALGTALLGGGISPEMAAAALAGGTIPTAIVKMLDRFASNPQTSRDLIQGARGRVPKIANRAAKATAVGAAQSLMGGGAR